MVTQGSAEPLSPRFRHHVVDGHDGGPEVETEVPTNAGDQINPVEDDGLLGHLLGGLVRVQHQL